MTSYPSIEVYNPRLTSKLARLDNVQVLPLTDTQGIVWAPIKVGCTTLAHLGHLKLLQGGGLLSALQGWWMDGGDSLSLEGELLLFSRRAEEVPLWTRPYRIRDLVLGMVLSAPKEATHASTFQKLLQQKDSL